MKKLKPKVYGAPQTPFTANIRFPCIPLPPTSYSLLRPSSHASLLLLTTPTTTDLGRTTPITTHTHHQPESTHRVVNHHELQSHH
ncbi:unnamed protein product [Sphenostylis stenocarpa]|uniref:Uncharacterized protein n=1 Tax=Sphenostylis stenocarpa TaxID=92480 RepID=A0AA86VBR5_9FABA|nr:unnamed protein product [Sphenostylis stenocarpa]